MFKLVIQLKEGKKIRLKMEEQLFTKNIARCFQQKIRFEHG